MSFADELKNNIAHQNSDKNFILDFYDNQAEKILLSVKNDLKEKSLQGNISSNNEIRGSISLLLQDGIYKFQTGYDEVTKQHFDKKHIYEESVPRLTIYYDDGYYECKETFIYKSEVSQKIKLEKIYFNGYGEITRTKYVTEKYWFSPTAKYFFEVLNNKAKADNIKLEIGISVTFFDDAKKHFTKSHIANLYTEGETKIIKENEEILYFHSCKKYGGTLTPSVNVNIGFSIGLD